MIECEIKFYQNKQIVFTQTDETSVDEIYRKDFEKYWISGEDHMIQIYFSRSKRDCLGYIIPDYVIIEKDESKKYINYIY